MVLGSEGRLGIVTEATVRATRLPEREEFHGLFFPAWEAAATALRHVVQARLPLSMLRLSTPEETRTNLVLAGHERAIAALERILAFRGARTEKCLLLVGLTGRARIVRAARRDLLALVKPLGALNVGFLFGNAFKKNRFRAPYLRNELWERGYAVDTLETAAPWSRIPALLAAVESALRDGLSAEKERVHVFTHLSHAYVDGSSLYTTYVFRLAPDPERNLARWRRLKDAASRAIVAHGGTISHQHGVGLDHRPYLAAEKGPLGLALIGALARRCDPDGIMNPGKLLPEEAES
jgi:alkyldihydroxyacetonephosphate synthase